MRPFTVKPPFSYEKGGFLYVFGYYVFGQIGVCVLFAVFSRLCEIFRSFNSNISSALPHSKHANKEEETGSLFGFSSLFFLQK